MTQLAGSGEIRTARDIYRTLEAQAEVFCRDITRAHCYVDNETTAAAAAETCGRCTTTAAIAREGATAAKAREGTAAAKAREGTAAAGAFEAHSSATTASTCKRRASRANSRGRLQGGGDE